MLRLTLPSDSMTTSRYKNRFYFVRQVIMVAVIACLCISTSEGLRLAPFPIFGSTDAEAATRHVRHRASVEASNNYNPTIVPTRPLRRGKQQAVHYESLTSLSARKLALHPVFLPLIIAALNVVSPLLSSSIPSRAPPFAS
jgi:hypothetical protein